MPRSSQSITTTALLESLFREEDPSAWKAFDARLRPVMLRVAKGMGLSDADAQDAAQECWAQIVAGARTGGYDRARGGLFPWVISILKNRVRDEYRRRGGRPTLETESVLVQFSSDDDLERIRHQESRRQLILDAQDALRESHGFSAASVQAFELLVLEGKSGAEVASELQMSRWAVYKASQRCKERFKELLAELTSSYEFHDCAD